MTGEKISRTRNFHFLEENSMKMKFLFVLALILGHLAFNGCGTLFKGTTQGIRVDSSPQGSIVEVAITQSGMDLGSTVSQFEKYTTPATIQLPRSKAYLLTVSKEGYKTETIAINRRISGGILILDILGGIVPVVVDIATGAWYNLDPGNVKVTLKSNETGLSDIPINFMASKNGTLGIEAPESVKIKIEVVEPNTE